MTQELSPRAQALIAHIKEQDYVCPWGGAWDGLWKLLPEKKQVNYGWEPPLPLILTGWYYSNNLAKSLCLRKHIEWADRYGVIDQVDSYLRQLPHEEWHTWQNSKYPNGM